MRGPDPVAPAGFPASCARSSHHSVPTHLMCPTWLFVRSPFSTGIDLWLLAFSSSLGLRSPLAGSPSTSGRIGFVILRTSRLPPLLPTVESLHRSPFGLPGDELLPEADLHRSDRATRRRTSTRALACLGRRPAGRNRRVDRSLNGDLSRCRRVVGEGADHGARGRVRSPASLNACGSALTSTDRDRSLAMRISLTTRVHVALTLLVLFAPSASGALIPGLFNTGVNTNGSLLGAIQIDPHYTLIESDDPKFPGPDVFTFSPGKPVTPGGWVPEGPSSRWIAPNPYQAKGNLDGFYLFRTTFDLTGFDPDKARINGRWAVGNWGFDIRLNEVSLGIILDRGWAAFSDFAITNGFITGTNTIDFLSKIARARELENGDGTRRSCWGPENGYRAIFNSDEIF